MDVLPLIFVVDDEPVALTELSQALVRRFSADYRILSHVSARAALEHLQALTEQGRETALVIAKLWMKEMTGRELLARAHRVAPAAKRGLLVAWGDRRSAAAILQGCAFDELDNYLLTPFQPAEVHLYPLVGEFLSEWTRANRPPLEIVRVVGERNSRRCHELHELFERNGISHGLYFSDTDEGQALLSKAGLPPTELPAVLFHTGTTLSHPTNAEIAEALGVTTHGFRRCDLVILGGGPAGLASAVYAASEGLRTLIVEPEAVGGQAGTSSLIRNYLGFPRGISGSELAQRAYQQAWLFGARYVFAREAVRLRARGMDRVVTLSDGSEIVARAVLVATGASYRRLDCPRIEEWVGSGVFYTALGDPRVLQGREVFVVGGGNSAGQAVVHLAKKARRVTLLVRGDSLTRSMSDYLIQELHHLTNVEVRLRTEVIAGEGEHMLERIVVRDALRGTTEALACQMLFVLIGADPHTDWLAGCLLRDRHGFILTGRDLPHALGLRHRLETSMPGVFAAGDVRAGSSKRVASAVGEGAVAVQYIHEYLASPVWQEEPAAPVRRVTSPPPQVLPAAPR